MAPWLRQRADRDENDGDQQGTPDSFFEVSAQRDGGNVKRVPGLHEQLNGDHRNRRSEGDADQSIAVAPVDA